jgi:hypothetical protein
LFKEPVRVNLDSNLKVFSYSAMMVDEDINEKLQYKPMDK